MDDKQLKAIQSRRSTILTAWEEFEAIKNVNGLNYKSWMNFDELRSSELYELKQEVPSLSDYSTGELWTNINQLEKWAEKGEKKAKVQKVEKEIKIANGEVKTRGRKKVELQLPKKKDFTVKEAAELNGVSPMCAYSKLAEMLTNNIVTAREFRKEGQRGKATKLYTSAK